MMCGMLFAVYGSMIFSIVLDSVERSEIGMHELLNLVHMLFLFVFRMGKM